MPTPDATSESERERLDRRRSQYDPEQRRASRKQPLNESGWGVAIITHL